MERLGLWGNRHPAFPAFADFLEVIGSRGVGALEMVAMDMKARGMYVCRTLSFAGTHTDYSSYGENGISLRLGARRPLSIHCPTQNDGLNFKEVSFRWYAVGENCFLSTDAHEPFAVYYSRLLTYSLGSKQLFVYPAICLMSAFLVYAKVLLPVKL